MRPVNSIKKYLISIILCVLFLYSCYPFALKVPYTPSNALKRIRIFYPTFMDDTNYNLLSDAIEKNLVYLKALPPDTVFQYGSQMVPVKKVIETQLLFLNLIKTRPSKNRLNREIARHFYVFKATGRSGTGKVLFTGYYEPIFLASRTPNNIYKYPIYRRPDDLITIDLSLFREEFKGKRIIARLEGRRVLPYYSRKEIESYKVLHGKNLEIAWLKDPLDVAFLHIQGSGRLLLRDGTIIRVGYDSSNGRPYRSIGRYMIEKGMLDWGNISMHSIRDYLSSHPQLMEEVLNYNPSYVFFRILDKGPIGSIGVPLTPGRSIALDRKLFPPGAICYIKTMRPELDNGGKIIRWKDFGRFVLNQDTGGAIKGPGRADIFWGSGLYAELTAGHMKHPGRLYILLKKE